MSKITIGYSLHSIHNYRILDIWINHKRVKGYSPVSLRKEAMYAIGAAEPRFPVPAIPLQVHWPADGYVGMIYIDTVTDPEDPCMVCCWDFYDVRDPYYGVYQATYDDVKAAWYKINNAWDDCPCCDGIAWHKPCIIDLLKQ